MTRTPVHSNAAPAAIGTYSQAISANGMIFVSGQLPLDPATGDIVTGDIDARIRQVFDNLAAVAEAGGSSLQNAVKIGVFLTDLSHFARVNEIMAEYFNQPYPARAAVQVSALPKGADVEADAILTA